MLREFRKGGAVTGGGGGGGGGVPARSRTRPGQVLFCCTMAETPTVRRKAPVSSAAKAHMYLRMIIDQRASYSQLVSKMANELLRSSRAKLSIHSLDFCII